MYSLDYNFSNAARNERRERDLNPRSQPWCSLFFAVQSAINGNKQFVQIPPDPLSFFNACFVGVSNIWLGLFLPAVGAEFASSLKNLYKVGFTFYTCRGC